MRGIRRITVVMGCLLGLAPGASAQVTSVVAGESITAAGINAIIDAVNGVVTSVDGNLSLPATTSTTGQVLVNGTRFLHSFGNNNTFLGGSAGNFTLTEVSEGNFNTGVGANALQSNTTGSSNTGVGANALQSNTTGSSNTAVGLNAGLNVTTGSNNIYLGANVDGVAGGDDTMYLGNRGSDGQTRTLIAGVFGRATADTVEVLIDRNGQLGTYFSTSRFLEAIHDMGDASTGLLDLRPVTFHYTPSVADGATSTQYGLIAEEVAEIYPDIVVYDDEGLPETVQYRKVNAMLLNEVQRQHRKIVAQQMQLKTLLTRLVAVERRLDMN